MSGSNGAAELLESHLSYPVLCFYRSQHSNQSWLAALTTILDVSALVMVGIDGIPARQARLTFAMARHAMVDLAQISNAPPYAPELDRLPASKLEELREMVKRNGIEAREGAAAEKKLAELRQKYEPYVNSLSEYLLMELPPWMIQTGKADNWQTSAWEHTTGPLSKPRFQDARHVGEGFGRASVQSRERERHGMKLTAEDAEEAERWASLRHLFSRVSRISRFSHLSVASLTSSH